MPVQTRSQSKLIPAKHENVGLQKWLNDRATIMRQYKDHPVRAYIRLLRKFHKLFKLTVIDHILFHFGEITPTTTSVCWPMEMPTKENSIDMENILRAFRIACPHMEVSIRTETYSKYRNSKSEFVLTWKEGEMPDIITNEYVFPKNPPISMRMLTF